MVSLLKEPGGGGGGFLKEDALEGDLDGVDMVRDFKELAVDSVVLDLPRPLPPEIALLDCTNRAGNGKELNGSNHGRMMAVPTGADDPLGDGHILNLL